MTEHFRSVRDDLGSIRLMVRANGRCPAEEFLASLDRVNKARFERFFVSLNNNHQLKSPEHMRHLKSAPDGVHVHELKSNKFRLYIVQYQACWYATHGRTKPADSRVPAEINKALTIFWERNGK